MTNAQIAAFFEQMADLLEFRGENAFRVRAYRNGARALHDLAESVEAIVADDWKRLMKIEGVGKAVAEKSATIVRTGELPQLTKLLEEIPETVLSMTRIPGLGSRKAAALYRELGITTLEELKQACEDQRIRGLKGFGAKTEEMISKGIAIADAANRRVYWSYADKIARDLREHVSACPSVQQLEVAGSYRRGRETVGDLDLLVVAEQAGEVMDRFAAFNGIADVLLRGDTKMSVRLWHGFQVDLRIVPAESFGAAMQYFTGSKEHNVAVRKRAKQRGMKVNEYGVYRLSEDGRETVVAGETEEDVYGALDLPWIPPELRESRREFEWAEHGAIPELITDADVVGDLHMHTTETDGDASLREMADAARQRGLRYIAITDHSQRVSMARGLNSDRLRAQWREIDHLNEEFGPDFVVLKGIECDILESGGMDLPDDVLAQADWVLASIHYGQRQSEQQITERLLGAIEHPHVSAVAHPTGRLINKRDPYEVDMETVLDAARKNRKLLELNANPMRLDLNDVHCAAARERGIPIVICTDAHSVEGLDTMRFGILQARRGGLTRKDVANTRSWSEMKQLIG